jgi:hypothetical protein
VNLALLREYDSDGRIVDLGENCRNLPAKNGATLGGGGPDNIPVDSEVGVDKDVAERDDLGPRNFRVGHPDILANTGSGFADDSEFLYNRAAKEFGIKKPLDARSGDKLGDVVGRLDNVGQIEALMPHRRAGLL